jgi:hypothetical protein
MHLLLRDLLMEMKAGEHWRCINPLCKSEVVIVQGSKIGGDNPVCVCGCVLKKNYISPVLSALDFLRFEEAYSAVHGGQTE